MAAPAGVDNVVGEASAAPAVAGEVWPGVADPAGLLSEIAGWLRGYGNRGTRRTYAEGLGLPVAVDDLRGWVRAPASQQPQQWQQAVGEYLAALGHSPAELRASAVVARRRPPPAARGRLRQVHWFRWCVAAGVDPVQAGTAEVKAWLDALSAAGAAPATRDRMLGTLKALYGCLAETGRTAGNPAALNRRRLGLSAAGRTSSTVSLTTAQVRQLYEVAGRVRPGVSPLGAARARAVVALFTLGLRVSELCGLDRADLHVTRGRWALRVMGKGDKPRVVYLSGPAELAVTEYLRLRDSAAGSAVVRGGGRVLGSTPLVATTGGARCTRQGIWHLLRRVARAADGPLWQVAEALHPHALRHFYVTTAVEAGAQLVHVQADVGHTSIDTTEQVYNAAARDPSRSAVDLVAEALLGG